MKKLLTVFLLLLCALILFGCNQKPGAQLPEEPDAAVDEITAAPQPGETEETAPPAAETPVRMEQAPALRVFDHENEVEALRGTTSWHYDQGDGTQVAIEADSPTPQRMKELMPVLVLIPSPLSHIDPLAVYLQWDVVPDRVRVCSWPDEDFGVPGARSEEVTVKPPEDDEGIFAIRLSSENQIYEVRAEWERFENWGGSASYCFYGTVATLRTEAPAE